MSDEDVWFEPKLFGYGAGLPVRWQGWALLVAYLAAVTLAALTLARDHHRWFIAAMVLLTLPLIAISAHHTRGGWRWRWGGD